MPLDLQQLHDAVITGDNKVSHSITEQALEEGIDPLSLVNEYMMPAMDEVGRRFETNEYYVPELLLSARAMKASLGLIRPLLTACDVEPLGRVISGTVKGDLHDIGKNLVGSMLEGGGFEVFDLGTDVAPEQFVEAAKEHKAHIIALSALLTTTMPSMKLTVEAFIEDGTRDQVKIFIGGAPVTQEFADEIGADGYSKNAVDAVAQAKQWMAASA
ncbi:MAG: cobalamin-binding protein [Planctomycetaceae bacterium]|jgi:corrinoid protein of di/trimethylamine methyltransferase|nr:cobalamin-binding protein [Planctomycetaceae bacterium]|tara:strand:+ start:376 stop:1020 length:645 start_codon:yes stop_codon:yes gene_type:complete